ncbi:MAG: hypothetical protein ACTHN7_03960 [Solirubrobacterales bacterium]
MRPRLAVILLLGTLLVGAALAQGAEISRKGNLEVLVDGKLSPKALPRHGAAPVSVSVSGVISTTDGTVPPQLRTMQIDVNRHGRFDMVGLPLCRYNDIQPASDARALAACRSALVGEGHFAGTIALPGSAEPFPMEGRLLLFNGRQHGRPVLFGHIYSPKPFASSFVLVFEMRFHAHGTYGTTLTANLAKALGAKRNLESIEMTLSRRYRYRGARHSYISAGCPAPKGFPGVPSFPLARTSFSFAGGKKMTTVLNKSCRAKG